MIYLSFLPNFWQSYSPWVIPSRMAERYGSSSCLIEMLPCALSMRFPQGEWNCDQLIGFGRSVGPVLEYAALRWRCRGEGRMLNKREITWESQHLAEIDVLRFNLVFRNIHNISAVFFLIFRFGVGKAIFLWDVFNFLDDLLCRVDTVIEWLSLNCQLQCYLDIVVSLVELMLYNIGEREFLALAKAQD